MNTKPLLLALVLSTIGLFANAQTLEWAKQMGGAGLDEGYSIAVDASGNVYTTGTFQGSADFDLGVDTFNLISAGNSDIFISKLSVSGRFEWAKQIGGADSDLGVSIVVDFSGNVYTTGRFGGTVDFNPSADTFNLTSTDSTDIFICKLDASGNFIWAKKIGGTAHDLGHSITLDASGNIYTTGHFSGTADFDPGIGIFNLRAASSADVFVLKLDAAGNFVWAKRMGGTDGSQGISIAIDALGNVYTTGRFQGEIDFGSRSKKFNLRSAGGSDIFISKLDASGNIDWVKQMGGTGYDCGNSIALDASGNVYSIGYFQRTADFNPKVATYNLEAGFYEDVFVSKLDASGNFVWAKQMGGIGYDCGNSIAVDASGNIYAIGVFGGTADFDPGVDTFNLTSVGSRDIFISKLDALGNFVWAKQMGGKSSDYGYSIVVDASGNIYTTGHFEGTADFDPEEGVSNLHSAGFLDIFIQKLSQKQ